MSNELELDQKSIDDLLATANQELSPPTEPGAEAAAAAATEPAAAAAAEETAATVVAAVPTSRLSTFSLLKSRINKKVILYLLLAFILVCCAGGFIGYKMAQNALAKQNPLDRLIKNGITFEEKNLVNYAGRGDEQFVKDFLNSGMSADAVRSTDGWTPLMAAAFFKKADIVKLLLAHNASVDKQDYYGRTALMQACSMGAEDIVKLLLKSGANPDIQDKYGRTALYEAYFRKHAAIAELLKEHGANPDLGQPPSTKLSSSAAKNPPPKTPSAPDDMIIDVGRAGAIKIGIPISEIEQKFPGVTIRDKSIDGVKKTIATVYMKGQINHSFLLELTNTPSKLISNISVYDAAFATDKQIKIGSTVQDVITQYTISDTKTMNGGFFLVAKTMKMMFELDTNKNTDLSAWKRTGDVGEIPGDIKVKRILLY